MHGNGTTLVVAAVLVLAVGAGAGLVAAEDFPSATDGDISNGEELMSAEDNDDQVYQINYPFVLENHRPGHVDGAAKHYAQGLTENGTLYRIKLVSDDFGFANCEPSDASAFGIDRGNDDPGTNTDKSLLTAFKTYTSEKDFIDIVYYRESQLAGEPVRGSIYDQIVAAQSNCYDNPSEPGWYRINGTITGAHSAGEPTNYKIRDLSNWVYVCECSSRAEAEETLGPPPGQGDDGGSDGSGGDDGSGGSSTPTATPTPTPGNGASDPPTATATRTPTATPTPTPSDGDGDGDAGAASPTATPRENRGEGGESGESGVRDTATASPRPTSDGAAGGATDTATPSATATSNGGAAGGADTEGGATGEGPRTPTAGAGPGFGVTAAVGGLLTVGLLALRRD